MHGDEINNVENAKDRDAIEFLALAGSIWGDDQTLPDELFRYRSQDFLPPVGAISQYNQNVDDYLYTANAKHVFSMLRNRRMNKLNQGFDRVQYSDNCSPTPWWNTFSNLFNNIEDSDLVNNQQNEVLSQVNNTPSIKNLNKTNSHNSNEEDTNKKDDSKDPSNSCRQAKENNNSVSVYDNDHSEPKAEKSSEDFNIGQSNSTAKTSKEGLSNLRSKASTIKRGKRNLSSIIGKQSNKNIFTNRCASSSKRTSSKIPEH